MSPSSRVPLEGLETLVLGADDVDLLVRRVGRDRIMDEVIAELTQSLAELRPEDIALPGRDGFRYTQPHPCLLEWMPILVQKKLATIKIIFYIPRNPLDRDLPSVVGTVSLYDFQSGHLLALADAVFLTAIRTGAASAVASRVLARPDSRVVGLIGCGAQAVTQLHALSRLFRLEKALIHDRDPRVEASLAERAAFIGVPLESASSRTIEREADILCTATSVGVGDGPVVAGTELKPSVHINAVGSDLPGKTELPLSLLAGCVVCPDFREQALAEGECQQLEPRAVGPDLWELVKAPERFADLRERRTVFDSTGTALEDHVAMQVLLRLAREQELGTVTRLEHLPIDARDPYSVALGVDRLAAR